MAVNRDRYYRLWIGDVHLKTLEADIPVGCTNNIFTKSPQSAKAELLPSRQKIQSISAFDGAGRKANSKPQRLFLNQPCSTATVVQPNLRLQIAIFHAWIA
jgi:hypothetical protein